MLTWTDTRVLDFSLLHAANDQYYSATKHNGNVFFWNLTDGTLYVFVSVAVSLIGYCLSQTQRTHANWSEALKITAAMVH